MSQPIASVIQSGMCWLPGASEMLHALHVRELEPTSCNNKPIAIDRLVRW